MPKIVLAVPDSIYHAAFQKTASYLVQSVEDVLVNWLEDGYREEISRGTIEPGVAVVVKREALTLYEKTA